MLAVVQVSVIAMTFALFWWITSCKSWIYELVDLVLERIRRGKGLVVGWRGMGESDVGRIFTYITGNTVILRTTLYKVRIGQAGQIHNLAWRQHRPLKYYCSRRLEIAGDSSWRTTRLTVTVTTGRCCWFRNSRFRTWTPARQRLYGARNSSLQ